MRVSGPGHVYFSLVLMHEASLLVGGFGQLCGEFWDLSLNILKGDSKCIFPLLHTEEQVAFWTYFSQKHAKYNNLGLFYTDSQRYRLYISTNANTQFYFKSFVFNNFC